MKKERLDLFLVKNNYFESREKAQRYIMTGNVLVNNTPVDKPGTKISIDANIRLRGNIMPFVGRGGLKMEKALSVFPISLAGKIMMDIGASTGGFTDCALQNGVEKVYAVDVGYGQLAWKLQCSEQVVNWERTNIRNVTPDMLPCLMDFISIDVSFISLDKVLPVAATLLKDSGDLIALIKPQFEAGKGMVGKGGVVRDFSIFYIVIDRVVTIALENGLYISGLDVSPIRGANGNIEFLSWFTKDSKSKVENYKGLIEHVVKSISEGAV